MEQGRQTFDLLLGAEVMAARLEGHLRADPIVAVQWRSEAAIAESVASIGLEDVRLAEADLLVRIAENRAQDTDAPAAEDALAVLRFLRQPGQALASPATTLERIERLARRGDARREDAPEIEELLTVFSHVQGRAPLLEALRCAATYAWMTGRCSPVAERMVFVAAEHAARHIGPGRRSGAASEDPLRGLGGRIDADWICLPSLALSRGRFRIWSPGSAKGAREVVEGVALVLDQEIGRVISIRAWQETLARAGQGRHGRSRLLDAGRAFGVEPVMTATALADRLSVTSRAALNLLGDLADHGLVEEITHRRAARIWATPGIAAKLGGVRSMGQRPRRRLDEDKPQASVPGEVRDEVLQQRNLKEEGEMRIAQALAEFDAVLNEVDSILERRERNRNA